MVVSHYPESSSELLFSVTIYTPNPGTACQHGDMPRERHIPRANRLLLRLEPVLIRLWPDLDYAALREQLGRLLRRLELHNVVPAITRQ
jgi:hypothetical protein